VQSVFGEMGHRSRRRSLKVVEDFGMGVGIGLGSQGISGNGQERRLAVTKKEIVKTISEDVDLTQLKTKEVVQKAFDAIIDTLVRTGRIELRNFGVFEVKKREPRKARNPRTGAEVYVPAKNVVTFKPGKEMADKIRWAQAAES